MGVRKVIDQATYEFGNLDIPGERDNITQKETSSLQKVKIVKLVVVSKDFLADLGGVGPLDEVFHVLGHEEGRVRHHVWPNTNMS